MPDPRSPDGDCARRTAWRRVRRALPLVLALPLVIVAVWDVGLLGRVFLGKVGFPGDDEWMEGGQLYHAFRLLHGLPLYGDCSDGFLPFPYPPGHAALLAAVGSVFGLDYRVGRLVSITAFWIGCWLLGRELLKSSTNVARGALLALTAFGALAVSYPVAGQWYDRIRVDTLFVALLLGGAIASLPASYSCRRRALGWRRIVLAAGLLTAAIYTKQTAVFFIPWICLYALWRHRRSGVWLTVVTAALCAGLLGLLQWRTEGRFWTFVFQIMSRHPVSFARSAVSTSRLLVFARFLPLVPLLALFLWRKRWLRSRTVFWLGMLICALGASITASTKLTAYLNNLMPAAMLCWPAGLLLVSDLMEHMRPRSWTRLGAEVGLCAWAALQLSHLAFIPRGYLLTADQWRTAHALNRYIAAIPGTVLLPAKPFVPLLVGRRESQIHRQSYTDVVDAGLPEIDLVKCLAGIHADWLILDWPGDPYFDALMESDYESPAPVPDAVRQMPGLGKPDRIYRRKHDPPSAVVRLRRRLLFAFEEERFDGWQQAGEAFRAGPRAAPRPGQNPVAGFLGHGLCNSYDPELGERARGTLRSEEFVIDRSHLGLRAGGGDSPRLSVALEIEGRAVRRLTGPGANVDMLVPVIWDVGELQSERGRIVIDDDETGDWGHLLVDQIELFDVP